MIITVIISQLLLLINDIQQSTERLFSQISISIEMLAMVENIESL